MKIKIINGTYGHKSGKYVERKTVNDEPFEVDDEKGKKLISKKIAVEVVEDADYEIVEGEQLDATKAQVETGSKKETDDEIEIPEYSEKTTKTELKEIMEKFEIEVKDTMKKEDMIAALDEFFSEEDGEEPPELGAEDVVE